MNTESCYQLTQMETEYQDYNVFKLSTFNYDE